MRHEIVLAPEAVDGLRRPERRLWMKQVPLSEVKNDLSRYLRLAETEAVIITRHGQPAGVLIGFADEDAWFEFRLQHDPRYVPPRPTAAGP